MAKKKAENKPGKKKWHIHKYTKNTGRWEGDVDSKGRQVSSRQKKCAVCEKTKWTKFS